jgi:hypothetical protein
MNRVAIEAMIRLFKDAVTLHIGYWWESQKERYHWEDQDVDGWTILKWILER